jgi:glycoside/pentoside/hexuronide:cation symporter, GPH family
VCSSDLYFVRADQLALIFALHASIMFVLGPTSPIVWAMYADSADYSEWRSGRRATGMVFSAASFAQKSGGAIGGGLLGLLLAWFGYEANVQQTGQSLRGILLMMSFIPAAFGLLAAVAVRFYRLDEPTMARIEAEVAQRKAQ